MMSNDNTQDKSKINEWYNYPFTIPAVHKPLEGVIIFTCHEPNCAYYGDTINQLQEHHLDKHSSIPLPPPKVDHTFQQCDVPGMHQHRVFTTQEPGHAEPTGELWTAQIPPTTPSNNGKIS